MPDTLRGLLVPGADCCVPGRVGSLATNEAGLTTVLNYGVATYGRERLSALVDGMGEHESWKTLIPAVFGVSAADFETGWWAYVAR